MNSPAPQSLKPNERYAQLLAEMVHGFNHALTYGRSASYHAAKHKLCTTAELDCLMKGCDNLSRMVAGAEGVIRSIPRERE